MCIVYMSNSSLSADQACQQLYEVMKKDLSFGEMAKQAFSIGERYLNVENGPQESENSNSVNQNRNTR